MKTLLIGYLRTANAYKRILISNPSFKTMFTRYGSVSLQYDLLYGSRVFILVPECFGARKRSSSVPMKKVERNRLDLFCFVTFSFLTFRILMFTLVSESFRFGAERNRNV